MRTRQAACSATCLHFAVQCSMQRRHACTEAVFHAGLMALLHLAVPLRGYCVSMAVRAAPNFASDVHARRLQFRATPIFSE